MVAAEAVRGTVADGFEAVRDQFAAVAASEPGLGAQLAAYRHGELVVDLWAGPELDGDSLLGVYSAARARLTWWPRCWSRTGCWTWTSGSATTGPG